MSTSSSARAAGRKLRDKPARAAALGTSPTAADRSPPPAPDRDWLGRLGEARDHLAAAQVELLKAVRAALVALEGSSDGADGVGRLSDAGGALGALVAGVVRYADRVARRREADARLKTLATIREVLVAERRAVAEAEGIASSALGGFDAVIAVIERECAAARADGTAPDEARRQRGRGGARTRPVTVD